jgi:uncharacterized protein YkwD
MKGTQVLATVTRGERAKVLEVQGAWVGVEVGDKRGWLLRRDVAPWAEREPPAQRDRPPAPTPREPSKEPAVPSQPDDRRRDADRALSAEEIKLWPMIDNYRTAFRKAAESIADQRKNDPAEIERLRQQTARIPQAEQIRKELIAEVEPHLLRLQSLWLIDRRTVLNSSPELARQRADVLRQAVAWEQAVRRWADLATQPHTLLTERPSAERLVQWQEQLAVQLVLPISEASRETLLANRYVVARLDPEEAQGVHRTNQLRMLVGVRPVRIDPALVAAARDHAHDMRTLEFFGHESPVEGKRQPSDRAQRFGTIAWGENIAWGSRQVRETIDMWFHSPGHLSNMTAAHHRRLGLGRSGTFWTLMLGH